MSGDLTIEGQATIIPPLCPHEVAYLTELIATDQYRYCHWQILPDGTGIVWTEAQLKDDGGATEWLTGLIDGYLAADDGPHMDELGRPDLLGHFTYDHTVAGLFEADGPEPGDSWQIAVTGRTVTETWPATA